LNSYSALAAIRLEKILVIYMNFNYVLFPFKHKFANRMNRWRNLNKWCHTTVCSTCSGKHISAYVLQIIINTQHWLHCFSNTVLLLLAVLHIL